MDRWRLILDVPLSGAENMAADEAILRASEEDPAVQPTLRIYGWNEPTISLGYLQKAAPMLSFGLPVVRRLTGGRAVLHDMEVTYSIIAPSGNPNFAGGINGAYSAISRCIIGALTEAGIEASFSKGTPKGGEKDACFHSPSRYEVLLGGRKLVGSSQRRFRNTFLQHGSIIFSVNKRLNEKVFGADILKRMSSISEFGDVDMNSFKRSLVDNFGRGLNASFEEGALSGAEERFRGRLLEEKYLTPEWNLHGTNGDTVKDAAAELAEVVP